ncbi:helix-turn-helix domain-containing protein [Polaromonas sp. JS666]|uniref:helix-turn-helix domain-containing protein n=1 Tax=Polaromonas sp. (strain JS666 / ATCC BAA-500) TaxID=296591 RepID=UPI0000D5B484|nr:helix-turn-helix transcriptional regulator [Polaromonas sp. JS666]ABE46893.1 transcriptional regulator, XRE family [Polaromonas sp. JS666]
MNLAAAFKSEIARVARKESRGETQSLKKASSQYRTDIAALKRRVVELERLVARLSKHQVKAIPPRELAEKPTSALRFSATGLAAQRKRLGLSEKEVASILGVSDQSIRKWESGQSHPRASQLPGIASLRRMGKREAAATLAEISNSA